MISLIESLEEYEKIILKNIVDNTFPIEIKLQLIEVYGNLVKLGKIIKDYN